MLAVIDWPETLTLGSFASSPPNYYHILDLHRSGKGKSKAGSHSNREARYYADRLILLRGNQLCGPFKHNLTIALHPVMPN